MTLTPQHSRFRLLVSLEVLFLGLDSSTRLSDDFIGILSRILINSPRLETLKLASPLTSAFPPSEQQLTDNPIFKLLRSRPDRPHQFPPITLLGISFTIKFETRSRLTAGIIQSTAREMFRDLISSILADRTGAGARALTLSEPDECHVYEEEEMEWNAHLTLTAVSVDDSR